jgi:hypothetical protein
MEEKSFFISKMFIDKKLPDFVIANEERALWMREAPAKQAWKPLKT